MPPPANTVSDGFAALHKGMDSGVPPEILEPGQYSFGVNCICRGGFIRPRPGYRNTKIDLGSNKSGLCQGVGVYDTEQGWQNILAQISGKLFQIDVRPTVPTVQEITPAVGGNDPARPQAWMYQLERNVVVQNGQDRTWIFNGALTRRAGPLEIPTGTVGCYAMGRAWQSLMDGRTFIGGGLVFCDGTRDSVLKVTENQFLNESKVFFVPAVGGRLSPHNPPAKT